MIRVGSAAASVARFVANSGGSCVFIRRAVAVAVSISSVVVCVSVVG